MSRTAAKLLCLMVLCLACCMSWPAPVLYGHSSIYIPEHNVTGIQCGNVDRLKGTKYMAFFNVGLVLIFIIVFVTLSVLYFLIWRVVMKHTPLVGKSTSSKDAPSTQTTDSHEKQTSKTSSASQSTENTRNDKINGMSVQQSPSDQSNTLNTSGDNAHDMEANNVTVDTNTKTVAYSSASKTDKTVTQVTPKRSDKSLEAARRTTIIFTLIATLLFVSYVPHLTMKIVMFLNTDYVPSLPYVNRMFFKTFVWCFFINNMANPFVYGFYDKQFRKHVRILYRKLPSIVCKKRSK